jgi:hypothetical protein
MKWPMISKKLFSSSHHNNNHIKHLV